MNAWDFDLDFFLTGRLTPYEEGTRKEIAASRPVLKKTGGKVVYSAEQQRESRAERTKNYSAPAIYLDTG